MFLLVMSRLKPYHYPRTCYAAVHQGEQITHSFLYDLKYFNIWHFWDIDTLKIIPVDYLDYFENYIMHFFISLFKNRYDEGSCVGKF